MFKHFFIESIASASPLAQARRGACLFFNKQKDKSRSVARGLLSSLACEQAKAAQRFFCFVFLQLKRESKGERSFLSPGLGGSYTKETAQVFVKAQHYFLLTYAYGESRTYALRTTDYGGYFFFLVLFLSAKARVWTLLPGQAKGQWSRNSGRTF